MVRRRDPRANSDQSTFPGDFVEKPGNQGVFGAALRVLNTVRDGGMGLKC